MKDIDYWLQIYISLRKQGEFVHADSLREMLRRMGCQLKTNKEGNVYYKEV